jgi:leucyl-tRNA---protein transferase
VGEPPRHERQKRRLAEAIERAGARPGPPFECPYLPHREARHLALRLEPLQPGLYHALMDLNFRRLGEVFYRPQCDGCDACRMIRLPVAEFRPSRAQRRCWKRNADLHVEIGAPRMSDEKQALYKRYLRARHDGQMDGSPAELHGFLYSSPTETLELGYSWQGRLIGVGIVDVEPAALSAVYCYFDPTLRARSLGVFNVLRLLDECRRRGLAHLYLGYYVRGCANMDYKARYRPCEILEPGRGFVRYEAAATA